MSDEAIVAEWSESPFTGVKRRGDRVDHRVAIETYDGVGVDVRHDARLNPSSRSPEEWSPVEVFEARPHGIEHIVYDRRWSR